MWSDLDYRPGVTCEPSALDLVSLSVARNGRPVLAGVSICANQGEILAVVGPNGAGKTTLLEAIVGLLPSTTKGLAVHGVEIRSFAQRAQAFAYMPDEARLPDEVSVRGLLAAMPNGERAAPHVRRLGVSALLERRGDQLSRGESKRVSLALTMAQGRPIIVLDEPFGAFDPLQLDDVLEVVRDCARAGTTIIVTVHQMSTAERIADRIVLLAEGRSVATGTLEELRALAGVTDAPFEDIFRRLLSQRSKHVPA